jgi:Glycosyl transferase family 2/Galactosyltransferase
MVDSPIGWFVGVVGDSEKRCTVDFVTSADNIALHISVRRADKCIVINRRTPTGWQNEIRIPIDAHGSGVLSAFVLLLSDTVLITINSITCILERSGEADPSRWRIVASSPDRTWIKPVYHVAPAIMEYVGKSEPESLSTSDNVITHRTLGFVEGVDGAISLWGWACTAQLTPSRITVEAGGDPVECIVRRVARPDVLNVLLPANIDIGFEIELPGYIWTHISPDGELAIRVLADGEVLALGRIRLTEWETRPKLIEYCRDDSNDPERQPLMLLALEHLAYMGNRLKFDDQERSVIRSLADKFKLSNIIEAPTGNDNNNSAHLSFVAEFDAEARRYDIIWNALREVSAKISYSRDLSSRRPESAFAIIRDAINSRRFRGVTRRNFLACVFDLLCESSELARIAEITDIREFDYLATSNSIWDLSTASGVLMVQKRFDEVAIVMYEIAKRKNGWLSTFGIHFVSRTLVLYLEDESISDDLARKIFYGILEAIGANCDSWFSRGFDQKLTEAVVNLCRVLAFLPGFVSDDYCDFVLKNFGLHAAFWAAVRSEVAAGGLQLPPLLEVGEVRFSELEQLVTQSTGGVKDEEILKIEGALLFFHRYKCRDVPIWIREIVIRRMAKQNAIGPFERQLIDLLGVVSNNDQVRLIAHCQLNESTQARRGPTEIWSLTRERIARLGGTPISPRGRVQRNAGRLIRSLEGEAKRVSGEERVTAILEIAKIASSLCLPGANFLGLDLLVGGIESIGGGRESDVLVDAMEYQLTRSSSETIPDGLPPASLFATRARLQRLIRSGGAEGATASDLLDYFDRRFSQFRQIFEPYVAESASLNGFHSDVVVAIYSCAANLDTQVEAIRRTWLSDLVRRGIPHVIVVGGGDGKIHGDVIHLDVADDYESLPDKTLALLRWFLAERQETYLIKIDDDCFLNVDGYFDSLSYRRFHYYGRRIKREVGSTDRLWHQAKSGSKYARLSIDRSPEPSVYADGGGGYSLSRFAVSAALAEADTRWGKRLKASSFLEDKFLGDLLSRRNITPANDEYESYQRRRTFAGAVPVAMWENSFFPSLLSPSIMVHLDRAEDQAKANAMLNSPRLGPNKIWPTFEEIGLSPNSNQLELLTDNERANELLRENLFVICVERNEKIMLPHFLQHYRSLGVRAFLFVDNLSDDGSREFLLEQPDVVLYSSDTEYKASHFGVSWQQAILGNHAIGKWALLADADEFLVLPSQFTRLQEVCDALDGERATTTCVVMVDMYPKGALADADFDVSAPFECAPWFDRDPVVPWALSMGAFSNAPTFVSRLRHRLLRGGPPHDFTSQKYALMRYSSGARIGEGVHYVVNLKPGSIRLWFAHFKYHRGFQQKVRAEIARGQHFNGAAEYRRYAGMLAESAGGFWDTNLSTRFEGPATFERWVSSGSGSGSD